MINSVENILVIGLLLMCAAIVISPALYILKKEGYSPSFAKYVVIILGLAGLGLMTAPYLSNIGIGVSQPDGLDKYFYFLLGIFLITTIVFEHTYWKKVQKLAYLKYSNIALMLLIGAAVTATFAVDYF